MKRTLSIIVCIALVISAVAVLASCGNEKKTPEIAVVTDVGQLMDKGFNQGTYEGAQAYAEAKGIGYKYYQPANGSDATDNDRIDAMKQAITNGAKIIVAPGFLQAKAMETVAKENPDVKFVFVDGWALGLDNVTAIVYKEQESGYLAGYAAVMEGYTKLGFTGGGGGTNPAVCRFGYGFLQGAEAAAKEKAYRLKLNTASSMVKRSLLPTSSRLRSPAGMQQAQKLCSHAAVRCSTLFSPQLVSMTTLRSSALTLTSPASPIKLSHLL